jgi:hypothetical protein
MSDASDERWCVQQLLLLAAAAEQAVAYGLLIIIGMNRSI